MTPQEQQMLQGLTERVNQTQLPDKDAEAEQYLQQALGRNPDAVYILAQTVLVQQYALDQAKQQLDQMRQQPPPPPAPAKHTSFLGNLLGMNDGPQPQAPPQQQYQPVQTYAPPPPQYGQPMAYGAPSSPTGIQGGGFLRSAMQTATGVAAGALAFEGIESLMHGFGAHAGYGGGAGFGDYGMGGGQPREEIVNNYYGDDANRDTLRSEADRQNHLSPDIDDRRDDNRAGFADTDSDDTSNDTSNTDDGSSYDDSSSDDSGSDDTSY